MFDELLKTFEECSEPHWDGCRAQAVRKETYHLAHQFLAALPLGAPAPCIKAGFVARFRLLRHIGPGFQIKSAAPVR